MSDSTKKAERGRRNHKFDLLRILFATFVLLAHAPELTDGNLSRELLARTLHTSFNFGALGVDGFFLLSGFLIVQSWQGNPEFSNFFRKRLLRIVPGYVVAALLATLVVGLLAPGVPHFFKQLNHHYVISVLMLGKLATPPVFPGSFTDAINGSLWTIPYEVRCYFIVALWGICGFFRRPLLWLGTTVFLLFLLVFPALTGPPEGWRTLYYLTGQPAQIARLTSAFFVGGCFWLFRRFISFRGALALPAAVIILVVAAFGPTHIEPAIVVFGGYLLFYFGQLTSVPLGWMRSVPDISYGVYLYGGPVEGLWIWYLRGSPWVAFVGATIISFALGWLSWHFVERPMLTFKRRTIAPLPPP